MLNPLCTNATAPRHRTARAAERAERMLREALTEASAVRSAEPPAFAPGDPRREAAAIGAMLARGEHVDPADLDLLRRRLEAQA